MGVTLACAIVDIFVVCLIGILRGNLRGTLTSKPSRRVACRFARSLADLVVLGVSLTLAVVQATNDDGSIDVAFDEVDYHFLADAGYLVAAPIGTGDGGEGGGNTHPGAALFIARCAGVGVTVGVAEAAVAVAVAAVTAVGRALVCVVMIPLPVKLDLNTVITICVDHLSFGAYDDGGLLSLDARFRIKRLTLGVVAGVAVRDVATNGGNGVAIQRALVDVGVLVSLLSLSVAELV